MVLRARSTGRCAGRVGLKLKQTVSKIFRPAIPFLCRSRRWTKATARAAKGRASRRMASCRTKHLLARAKALRELTDAEWITIDYAESRHGVWRPLSRYGLSEPKLALRSQSALTLLTRLAYSDFLRWRRRNWTMAPFANRFFAAIPLKKELSAPSNIAVGEPPCRAPQQPAI
jgi:hypothetical protein